MPLSFSDLNPAQQLQDADQFLIHQGSLDVKTTVADIKAAIGVAAASAATLTSAHTYTDSAATATLASAHTYADSTGAAALASARTYADGVAATAVTTAHTYSDSAAGTALNTAHTYTDSAITTATPTIVGQSVAAVNSELAVLGFDIVPSVNGHVIGDVGVNLGSPTKYFKNVYADEVHIGPHSLYVNGKQVVSDNSNTMTFSTDIDQSILLKSTASSAGTGVGNIGIQADGNIDVTSKGDTNYNIASGVAGKNINFTNSSSGGKINFNGSTVVSGDFAVTGNLSITGTTTTVNTTQVNILDNLITLNSNQTGTPPSNLIGGIEINRGDSPKYRIQFDEASLSFKVGELGSLQKVATREDSPLTNGVAVWNNVTNSFKTVAVGNTAGTIAAGDHLHTGVYATAAQGVKADAAQPQLSGVGFVKTSGTTVSYDNTAYAPLASPVFTGTISGGGLGTAAFTASASYATAAQGVKADAALPAASYTATDVVSKLTSANPATQGRFVICGSGTTFPATPGFADEFYRTDLDEWYKYNGAVWTQI
jgi:hypothetical protein